MLYKFTLFTQVKSRVVLAAVTCIKQLTLLIDHCADVAGFQFRFQNISRTVNKFKRPDASVKFLSEGLLLTVSQK